jgi:glucokinase
LNIGAQVKTQMKIERYALALDVGGTFLKSALISSKGSILEESFMKVPIDSKGTKDAIIGTFIETMLSNLEIAEKYELEVVGIGIGTPGPFNYDDGISLMKHKFKAIYGLNLKHEFMRRLSLEKGFRIRFEVDAWSSLRGEAWLGAAQGYDRTVGVTLGTGLGSAFMANNQIVINGSGVPPHAWIGGLPNNNGIVEDKISQRGILARYKELSENKNSENLTVREIAFRGTKNNDRQSLQVFEELGSNLGQVLRPILSDFNAQCLVLGGQISKSFNLFDSQLKNSLQSIQSIIKISQAQLIDRSALYGATKLVFLKKIQSLGVIGINE